MSQIHEIISYETKLNNLFKLYPKISTDTLIQSHWARYLCVLSAGYLEISVRAIFKAYAKQHAHPNIVKYVEIKLKKFQSAKMNNIIDLARTFDQAWALFLEKEKNGELEAAVNSIVDNRHNIAHGKDTGVSFAYINEWYKKAVKLIEIIETMCLKK